MSNLMSDLLKKIVVGRPIPFPIGLFVNGEQGAWYDPSDTTTLFKDAAGNDPVTADGDPVGMMLDKSSGLALGEEQTMNGGFSSDLSSWSTSSHWVWDAGRAEMPLTSSFLPLSQDVGFVSGKFYQITIEVSAVSGVCKLHPGIQTNDYQFSTTGLVTFIALAGSGELEISRQASPSSCTIESVSVKELPGNHERQPVTGSKPIYRTDGTLRWLEFDGVDDFMRAGFGAQLGGPLTVFSATESLTATRPPGFAQTAGSLSIGGFGSSGWNLFNRGDDLRIITGTSSISGVNPAPAAGVYVSGLVWEGVGGNLTTTESDGTETVISTTGSLRNVPDAADIFMGGRFFGGIVVLSDKSPYTHQIRDYLASKAGVTL